MSTISLLHLKVGRKIALHRFLDVGECTVRCYLPKAMVRFLHKERAAWYQGDMEKYRSARKKSKSYKAISLSS